MSEQLGQFIHSEISFSMPYWHAVSQKMTPKLKATMQLPITVVHNLANRLIRHTLRNEMADRWLSSDYVIEEEMSE
jgi:hypothetical protein